MSDEPEPEIINNDPATRIESTSALMNQLNLHHHEHSESCSHDHDHHEHEHDHHEHTSECSHDHDHEHDHHHYHQPPQYSPYMQQQPAHHHHHGGGCCSHDHSAPPDPFALPYFDQHNQQQQQFQYEFKNKFLDHSRFHVESQFELDGIQYEEYKDESQMPLIMNLITKDLSEPYSIYTYRYFIHNWPYLCFLAMDEKKCIGAIVCKLDRYKDTMRGYIAMLDVDQDYRRKKIGSNLVTFAIRRMIQHNADEVVLETEVTNKGALHLYENLGFVRDKRLFRYYLNGVEAFRLKLWLK